MSVWPRMFVRPRMRVSPRIRVCGMRVYPQSCACVTRIRVCSYSKFCFCGNVVLRDFSVLFLKDPIFLQSNRCVTTNYLSIYLPILYDRLLHYQFDIHISSGLLSKEYAPHLEVHHLAYNFLCNKWQIFPFCSPFLIW